MYEGRHLKFVGLCGGGGNTGPARSRASGQVTLVGISRFSGALVGPSRGSRHMTSVLSFHM